MSTLGGYMVQHRYRVAVSDVDKLREILVKVRDHALDLGLGTFEIWIDDEDGGLISETHGYDSWSHWRRLADKEPSASMRLVYSDLDALIEGGLAAVETHAWRSVDIEP